MGGSKIATPHGSDQAPPGWYPVPQGGQRYWDGQRWLDLPDPNSGTANPTGRSGVRIIAIASALVVLMSIAIGAAVWKNGRDTRMRNAASAASSSKAAADAEADRVRRDTDAKHAHRADLVKQVEEAIKHFADTQGREGLFDGPVLDVSCDPVSGGSIHDLSAESTIFECFAATKDNGDGTRSGMKYHATVNWDTDHYTYGLGAPR